MTMATSEIPAVRRHDGVAVIDLAGDVNRGAEETLEAAWQQATAEQPDAVVLNFEGAGYINSTGIALIVSVLARARAERRKVVASGLSPHYREIFDITRLSDFIELFPDLDRAVSQLTHPAA
jgi:anti-anti-sigma factor